jgi:hypothetical protein
MNDSQNSGLSRRQFARRAALLSATASLAPAACIFPDAAAALPSQDTPGAPKLSPESQTEADARFQQILAQYGDRLTAEDKTLLQKMNLMAQSNLDRVRAFSLQNGDAPALYLKPLVEREKKKSETLASPAKKS